MTSWFRSLFGSIGQRTSGRPTSSNRASSSHLWWDVPPGERLAGVSVTLEVSNRPAIDDLVFMAIQATFTDPGGGGAHLGLQHHPRFPGRSAVNWGGYAAGGGLLEGSESPLVSTPGDMNTRDFPWRERVPYRLEIARGSELADGGWRWIGSVTDEHGSTTVVRELFSPGSTLRDPIVWTECFAACDAPPFVVKWSEPSVTTVDGTVIPVHRMRVAYQSVANGGCSNTNSSVEDSSFTQRTNTERTFPQDARLSID